jgi:hypothetical protein
LQLAPAGKTLNPSPKSRTPLVRATTHVQAGSGRNP